MPGATRAGWGKSPAARGCGRKRRPDHRHGDMYKFFHRRDSVHFGRFGHGGFEVDLYAGHILVPVCCLLEPGQLRLVFYAALSGEIFPYNFFPSEDGVLPFGITDSGEVLFWKLEKNCNWKIVINESRGPLCDEFDLGWAEFMVELLSARLESLVLPKKEFARVADFKSLTDI